MISNKRDKVEISLKQEYDHNAIKYDQKWKFYVERTVQMTLESVDVHRNDIHCILDLGCGTGALTLAISDIFPNAKVKGLDLSSNMIKMAQSRCQMNGQISFHQSSVLENPFVDNSFDLLISSSSFHFWPDLEKGLSEMFRIAKPGAQIIIGDWCNDYLYVKCLRIYLRLKGLEPGTPLSSYELIDLFQKVGLENVKVKTGRVGWKIGFMTVSGTVPILRTK